MHVAIATFTAMPPEFADDEQVVAALDRRGVAAERIPWDDPETDWQAFDAVVLRSPWDYARRRDEFVAWAAAVGPRLHNSPEVVRWNSDKRYLRDLAEAGIPVMETTYVGPGDPLPELRDEVVVKPNVSAGGRDTGRFSSGAHDEAEALIDLIRASGRTAMVQPFEESVESAGETAIVCLNGEPSHALRKRAILRPDEVAPVRDDGVGAAEVMYDPALVTADRASEAELDLAQRIVAHVSERFAYTPLYARVDMLARDGSEPVLLELEAIEPNLYLDQVAGGADRVAAAITARI